MKRFIAILLVTVLLASGLVGCTSVEVSYADNLDAYVKTMDYHDGFTILQLTDIHWNSGTQIGNDDYGSIRYIKKVVAEAVSHAGKIDLIEITGDTFMLTNQSAVNLFIDMMEDIGIPYAITWGNHDRESTYNPNWISEQFLKAPYSLYTEVDNDDVHERCNYIINLTDEQGNVKWQLSHLDSGASYREGGADFFLTYDYIRQDQLDWLAAEHELAGDDVPMICYYHIPQADSVAVYDEIQNGSTEYKTKFFKHEGFGSSSFSNTEIYDVFKSMNVKAIFMGHAHSNDWTYTTPDGIVYGFGVKTGTELYYTTVSAGDTDGGFEVESDFILSGASLVTLNNSGGDFKLEHLYLNERDGGDFVLWVDYDE